MVGCGRECENKISLDGGIGVVCGCLMVMFGVAGVLTELTLGVTGKGEFYVFVDGLQLCLLAVSCQFDVQQIYRTKKRSTIRRNSL